MGIQWASYLYGLYTILCLNRDQMYWCICVVVGFVFRSLLVPAVLRSGCYTPLGFPASFSVFIFADWGQVELIGSLR
jgi:hypothetical protein